MKKFTSKKQKIGQIGEQLAEMFLVKQGFSILDRNYSSRFGEIDLITRKDDKLYFFEIKTVTVSHETDSKIVANNLGFKDVPHETQFHPNTCVPRETRNQLNQKEIGVIMSVSRETFINEYRKLTNPFQNISKSKIKRSLKTIELYMSFKRISPDIKWQFDGIGVFLDLATNTATYKHLPNISIL